MSKFTRVGFTPRRPTISCILGQHRLLDDMAPLTIGDSVKFINREQAVRCHSLEQQAVVCAVEKCTVNGGYAFGAVQWTYKYPVEDVMEILPPMVIQPTATG